MGKMSLLDAINPRAVNAKREAASGLADSAQPPAEAPSAGMTQAQFSGYDRAKPRSRPPKRLTDAHNGNVIHDDD